MSDYDKKDASKEKKKKESWMDAPRWSKLKDMIKKNEAKKLPKTK